MKKKIMIALATVATMAITAVSLVGCGAAPKGVSSQIDALTAVKSNQAEIAIIDSTMANYLTTSDTSFKDLVVLESLGEYTPESEEYGVAAKKGNLQLIDKVNELLVKAQDDGTFTEIASKYGLENRMIEGGMKYEPNGATDGSWDKIVAKGEIVIAYTINAPMGIEKEDGTVSGFDIDLAKAIFEDYGISVKTKLIEWSSKEMELNSDKVDLVWNGLTITPDRLDTMAISVPYLTNKQAFVVKADNKDKFQSKDDLTGAVISYEIGSAGESTLVSLGLVEAPEEE